VVRYRIIVLKVRGRGTYSLSKGSPAETTTGLLELMKMSTYLSHTSRWKNNHAARAYALPRGGAFCARWLFTRSCKYNLAPVFPLSAQTNRSITVFEFGMILITICFTTNHDEVTRLLKLIITITHYYCRKHNVWYPSILCSP